MKWIYICIGLLGWLWLLCSPIGNLVAAVTICGLIGVLLIIGLIDVHKPGDRRK